MFKSRTGSSGVAKIVRDTYRKDKSGDQNSWYVLAKTIRERDEHTCQGCQCTLQKTGGEVHHIIPLSRGGRTTASNLILLCGACHEKRHPHLRRNSHRKK